jgi:hypothetical protein
VKQKRSPTTKSKNGTRLIDETTIIEVLNQFMNEHKEDTVAANKDEMRWSD